MIAVLFNLTGDVRLGEVAMPDACRLIAFGGGVFVRTDDEAVLENGALGVVFQAADRYTLESLDTYNPRKLDAEARGREVGRAAAEDGPTPRAEVGRVGHRR